MKIYAAMFDGRIVGLYTDLEAATTAGGRKADSARRVGRVYEPYVLEFNLKGRVTKINNNFHVVRTFDKRV